MLKPAAQGIALDQRDGDDGSAKRNGIAVNRFNRDMPVMTKGRQVALTYAPREMTQIAAEVENSRKSPTP